ncbi:PHOsphatase [Podila epigama]|nr:PHOsphatase [Podila epigama]
MSRTSKPRTVLSAALALLICATTATTIVMGSNVISTDMLHVELDLGSPLSVQSTESTILEHYVDPEAADYPVVDAGTDSSQSLGQDQRAADTTFSQAWLRKHLGTKSPYPHEDRPLGVLHDIPEGYDLVQLQLLNRHGTRYPSTGKSKAFQLLADKLKPASSSVPGLEWLQQWSSHKKFPAEKGDLLAAMGDSDLYQIGHRLQNRYGDFLDRYPYDANTFDIKSSAKPRCSQSGIAFSAGFFYGRYSDPHGHHRVGPVKRPLVQPVSLSTLPAGLDREIAVKYACPRWQQHVQGRPEVVLRQHKAFEERFIPSMAAEISQAFNGRVNVTVSDVSNIYQLCGFEISMYSEDQTWCRLLRPSILNPSLKKPDDRKNFLTLEILDDLDDYYNFGPGVPFNRHLGCVFGSTLLNTIGMALGDNSTTSTSSRNTFDVSGSDEDEDEATLHRGVFRFGHSETILFVSSFLGLYNQKGISLTGNMTMDEYRHREFKSSEFSPFAANIAFEVYAPKVQRRRVQATKPHQEGLIRMLVNEKPMGIPTCDGKMFCEWSKFKALLETAGAGKGCDFDGCCANKKGSKGDGCKNHGDLTPLSKPSMPEWCLSLEPIA